MCVCARTRTRFGALCKERSRSSLYGLVSFKDPGWDGVNSMFLVGLEGELGALESIP